MPMMQTRRQLLAGLSLASVGGLVRAPRTLAGEPPLETTIVRLQMPGLCVCRCTHRRGTAACGGLHRYPL